MTGMTGMTSNPRRGSDFFMGGPRKVIQQQKAQEGPFQTWMDQQGQGQGQGQVQEDLPDSQHQSLGPVGPQTTGQSQQQGHN